MESVGGWCPYTCMELFSPWIRRKKKWFPRESKLIMLYEVCKLYKRQSSPLTDCKMEINTAVLVARTTSDGLSSDDHNKDTQTLKHSNPTRGRSGSQAPSEGMSYTCKHFLWATFHPLSDVSPLPVFGQRNRNLGKNPLKLSCRTVIRNVPAQGQASYGVRSPSS